MGLTPAVGSSDSDFLARLKIDLQGFLTNSRSQWETIVPFTQSHTSKPASNACISLSLCEGSLFTFSYKPGKKRTVRLLRVLYRSDDEEDSDRCMIVFKVACACQGCQGSQGSRSHGECEYDWAGKNLVLKLRSSAMEDRSRMPEQKQVMDLCRDLAVDEHAWILNHLPRTYCSFELPPTIWTSQIQNHYSKKKWTSGMELRRTRGSIEDELKPVEDLKTQKEFAQVYFDVVQCHHWVYTYLKILHRDINRKNIMFREKDGEKYGVLNNWNSSLRLHDADKSKDSENLPPSRSRTSPGNPYLAHEQHHRRWKGPYRYRHDLESLFYVILYQSCLYSSPRAEMCTDRIPGDDQLGNWFYTDDQDLYISKHSLIYSHRWEPPVKPFFSSFSSWLLYMNRSVFAGLYARKKYFDNRKIPHMKFGMPPGPIPVVVQATKAAFDEDTLGGEFSYDEVVIAMHLFDDQPLEIRGNEWQQRLAWLREEADRKYAEAVGAANV
ncbi:hypothetical protein F5880DRAFT_1667493 [Lentinula raphanica]|nr:hypothetical protein F5880DRAFT_1667493 [Lentinula raphanica]